MARTLAARGIRATWEVATGHLPELRIGGAPVLWAAPWRADPEVQSDARIPLVDRRLGGTFVCAPFGRDDVDGGPPHGAPANRPWRVLRAGPAAVRATCAFARGHITATIAVRDDHPVLYQTHVLDLTAPVTFAHHPIFHLAGGGRISAPPPRAVLTFASEVPFLTPNARSDAWIVDGRDVRTYPEGQAEDFATIVADPGLGWTALRREAEGDTILTLRRAEQLPVTNLWFSNGARGGIWSGSDGLLGIEDGICAGAEGFATALSGRSRVAAEGVATVLREGRHVIPHAILRLPGHHDVRSVAPVPDGLCIATTAGERMIPFDEGHFR
ncbi:hypothetical protein MWU52_05510 [Jannaschia sp. S6380]|uniref:hypothetical protein n=1 Tax=Jannaschia sp. S6380 TaxID=2926408 RepID=UPI001FF5E7CD|nr:hypothetical protein [Jannaschia sp. S6380]MCK0167003.1 hypothetical protein [Jannaschia sp. S6380]